MITYREALPSDYKEIAIIHAASWKKHYKGILPDSCLDDNLESDRLEIWKSRFAEKNPNQNVILAEDEGKTIGFACTYLHHKSGHGSLLDNLHVLATHQGKSIGLTLMQKAFDWSKAHAPAENLFLTVLSENELAKGFYYKIGGTLEEEYMEEFPKGNSILVQRISWTQRPTL